MTTRQLNWKVMMLTIGLFAAISFTLCVVYGLIVPVRFHAASALETILPGFRWISPGSFVLGVVETFLYGAYAGLLLALLYNWLSRHLETGEAVR